MLDAFNSHNTSKYFHLATVTINNIYPKESTLRLKIQQGPLNHTIEKHGSTKLRSELGIYVMNIVIMYIITRNNAALDDTYCSVLYTQF